MTSLSEFSSTLKEHMAADKKKTVALFVLGTVLIVVVGRLFISGETPAPAAADDVLVVSTPAQATPRPTLMRPVPEVSVAANPRRRAGDLPRPSGAQFASLPGATPVSVEGMPRAATRDLFSTSAWDQFPPEAAEEEPQVDEGPSVEAQLGMLRAERRAAREKAMEAIRAEAQSLELQSTLTGLVRSAYISGRLVHEGDTISGFSVVRIEDRQVILSKSGVRQTLAMH